jgi:hypothetical protein
MAEHTRVEWEFALVGAGCEACAPCAISEAIETEGGGGAALALAGLTVKAITPVASAAADATATPRFSRHLESRRSMYVHSVENRPAHLDDAHRGIKIKMPARKVARPLLSVNDRG